MCYGRRLPYLCFAGEETSLRVNDTLSLGLGLCIQTVPGSLPLVPFCLEGPPHAWGDSGGAEARGPWESLSPVVVSQHTGEGAFQMSSVTPLLVGTDLPALV